MDDKTGVSDDDIQRMAAGMAAVKLLETETAKNEEESERVEKVCGEAVSITPRKPDDGWMERMIDDSAENNRSTEPAIRIPSPDSDITQSYPYNPSPFIPSNPTAPTLNTSPFIIPPPTTDHQGYSPQPSSYITSYNMEQPTPYSSSPPTIGHSAPSSHPSLPYGITPFQQDTSNTTAEYKPSQPLLSYGITPYKQDTPTTTEEYTPSAPPLIQRY